MRGAAFVNQKRKRGGEVAVEDLEKHRIRRTIKDAVMNAAMFNNTFHTYTEEQVNELKNEILNYRAALRAVIDYLDYDYCEDADTGEPCGGCPWCIATKALGRGK